MTTIFALSSGALPSGVAVVRVSGSRVSAIKAELIGIDLLPRSMVYSPIIDRNGQIIDYGLSVWFPGPTSFTGEDSLEFHIHGGKAVVARLIDELATFDDCRLAEAGEFSRRAFSNGKMDLSQAEGLADLIEAETEAQRRLALMGASGELAEKFRNWRQRLISIRANVEAELDFADEEDVQSRPAESLQHEVFLLRTEIEQDIRLGKRISLMRDGIKVVITGEPNSGKSSLINQLSGRTVAIVTPHAGTTRDALETRIVINGFPVLVIDTAGLRDTDDVLEELGINTAIERLKDADIIIVVEDMASAHATEFAINDYIDGINGLVPIWHIGNKSDIVRGDQQRWPLQISAKTGEGVESLIGKIGQLIGEQMPRQGSIVPARHRQLSLLQSCCDSLARIEADKATDLELIAEELRLASSALGRITGDIDVEDVLDVIFSEFCIGK